MSELDDEMDGVLGRRSLVLETMSLCDEARVMTLLRQELGTDLVPDEWDQTFLGFLRAHESDRFVTGSFDDGGYYAVEPHCARGIWIMVRDGVLAKGWMVDRNVQVVLDAARERGLIAQ